MSGTAAAEARRWIARGRPEPLGATPGADGVNFAVVAPHCAMTLVLFAAGGEEEVALDPGAHRTGEVWHVHVAGLVPPVEYGWRVPGAPPAERPAAGGALLDPYGDAVAGGERWGEGEPGAAKARRSLLPAPREPAPRPLPPVHPADLVVYEVGVRAFTAHPSSGVASPGTYDGLREKIPWLVELGVGAVELLPVAEWDELEIAHREPGTGRTLRNLWGYNPISFRAPKAGLAASAAPGVAVDELRRLVADLHAAGIRVLLDLVFNHTGERDGAPGDPTYSWRGLDRERAYLTSADGSWLDVTGCGNTVACQRPAMQDQIVASLRHWVTSYGVDGFRFDLATVLARGGDGEIAADPPLLARIEADPVLAGRLLVAEPWDAAAAHPGAFAARGRWSEWNGRFRDVVRRFVSGEPGWTGRLAGCLAGSADLFAGGPLGPGHSVNYVACHDGFTLADVVAYARKHNLGNGEGGRDGSDSEPSWNGGHEGPTDDPALGERRRRQVRSMLALLFCAQGVPMLLAGDEMGRSQRGNNNAWCRDDEVGWLDWRLAEGNADLVRLVRGLVAHRRSLPALRRRSFLTGSGGGGSPRLDVAWHGERLGDPDWSGASRFLAMHLAGEHGPEPGDDVYLAANGGGEGVVAQLPPPAAGARWVRAVDTSLRAPEDLAMPGEEPPVAGRTVSVAAGSVVVLRSRPGG